MQILHDSWMIPPIRQHDVFIMEAILDLDLSIIQLEQINACRMHLQVTTLVEIADHTGTMLLPQALLQKKKIIPSGLDTISHSKLQWPRIHTPTTACWKLWTKTICNVFTGTPTGMQLTHPLGPWTIQYDIVREWHWRLSPTGCLLHQINANV